MIRLWRALPVIVRAIILGELVVTIGVLPPESIPVGAHGVRPSCRRAHAVRPYRFGGALIALTAASVPAFRFLLRFAPADAGIH